MNESTIIGLANNAALLIALGLVFDTIVLKPRFEKTYVKVLTGIIFGSLGLIVMTTPWEFMPGVIFDTRSIILAIGGLFFGTIPTIIAVLMTSIFRYSQGGIGAWTGIAVIITSGGLGVLWRHKRLKELDKISLVELYIFGVVVHIAMLLWMLSLPWPTAKSVLFTISLPVMFLYPAGTLLLGKLLIARLKRKKEGDALLESEARWRSLTETSPDHILTLDNSLKIQFANFASPGLTVDDLIGTPICQYIENKEEQDEAKAILESVLRTGEQKSYQTTFQIPDEGTLYYETKAVPRKVEGSKDISGLTLSSRDITKNKQAEESLRKLSSAVKQSPASVVITDLSGAIEYVNPKFEQLTGYSLEEAVGENPNILKSGKQSDELYKEMWDTITTGKEWNGFFHNKKKNGELYWESATIAPIKDSDGKIINYLAVKKDITEQRHAEEKIKASLKEKETLIHEIHHRVKNNMNVISSLLSLQANNIEDKQTKEILKDSQSRVYAMSAVHETLHGSENLSEIGLKNYLTKITNSIFQTYSTDRGKVKLNSNLDDSYIRLNQASPLGLVINELISNSLKYAFPDERKGEIKVNMVKRNNQIEITIGDDGVGMPDGFDWKNSSTLGLKLVRTLVENQLDGSIDMENKNGTKFIIKFNIET